MSSLGSPRGAGGALLLPTKAARVPTALLLSALELHHADSAEHSRLCARAVQLLAWDLLPRAELRWIVLAALLHDVGKLGIDPRILRSEERLSPADWQAVKQHPTLGASLLGQCPPLAPVSALVTAHHERWDGTGYPEGLRGEAIPLGARLIAIADTLDCILLTGRPYQSAGGYGAARFELEAGSGSQFDPELVRAFGAIERERWEELVENGGA